MLNGHALQYYSDPLKGKRDLIGVLCDGMLKHFLYKEDIPALISEWELITLISIISKSRGKKSIDCLEMIISRLQEIM